MTRKLMPKPTSGRGGPRPAGSRPSAGKTAATSKTGETNAAVSTWRMFYALSVPATIADDLEHAQRLLKGNWRPVRADQFHITLSYLPSVPIARVPELRQLGQALISPASPLRLRLRGTGYFPNEGSPRVWFVKAEAEGLLELAEQLRTTLQAHTFTTDDQPFKPHITLARKKGPAPRVAPLTFEHSWTATAVGLYRSILRKSGPIYELDSSWKMADRPLRPSLSGEARTPLGSPQRGAVSEAD